MWAVAVFLGVSTLIPLGDLINVYANVGARHPGALAIHGGTIVFMPILAVWLLRARSRVLSDAAIHTTADVPT